MSFFVRSARLMKFGRLILLAVFVAAFSGSIACGSGSDAGDAESLVPVSSGDPELAEVSGVFASDISFTFDDFVAAGWKKSKQFDTSTVPEATDIWYGFYGGRDIEVRFYDSHDVARSVGFESAAAVIEENALSKVALTKAGGSAVTKYLAFAVVGNTVMLCEFSLDSCVALVDALGGGG